MAVFAYMASVTLYTATLLETSCQASHISLERKTTDHNTGNSVPYSRLNFVVMCLMSCRRAVSNNYWKQVLWVGIQFCLVNYHDLYFLMFGMCMLMLGFGMWLQQCCYIQCIVWLWHVRLLTIQVPKCVFTVEDHLIFVKIEKIHENL